MKWKHDLPLKFQMRSTRFCLKNFKPIKSKKVQSKEVGEEKRKEKEELRLEREREIEEKQKRTAPVVIKAEVKLDGPKQVGKIDLDADKVKKETKSEKKDTR